MQSIWRFLLIVVSLFAISASLASCGETTTTPTSDMTLRVAQNSTAFDYFPLYVAEQKGFFKDQGLTLNPNPPIIMGQAQKTMAAMQSGAIDIAAGTITDAFTVSRVNAHIKIIGTLSSNFTGYVIVSKKFEQQTHLTAASPLAVKVKALRDRKIGVPVLGSAMEALLITLFKTYGLDEQHDATIVNLGASNPLVALGALSRGSVDAVAFPVPTGEEAEIKGVGDIFINPFDGEIPEMVGQLNTAFYTQQAVIDAKPKAVQAFIRAMAQSDAFIQKNPAEATVLLGKYLKVDKKTLDVIAKIALPRLPETPQVDPKGYDEANAFHVKAGLIAIKLPYNDLVAEDTINSALSSH